VTSEDLGFDRLRRAMSSAVGAIDRARAAAPEESTATDASGAVEVAIDRLGRPVGVRVADDWSRRLSGEALAGAVLEAASRADAVLGQTMTSALADVQGAGAAEDDGATAAHEPEVPVFDGVPRPLLDLAELAVSDLGSASEERPVQVVAVDGRGGDHVTVRLGTAGMLDCRVDARWAGSQSGVTLSMHLNQALADASAQLREAERRRRDDDTLLAEAFAHLRALAGEKGVDRE